MKIKRTLLLSFFIFLITFSIRAQQANDFEKLIVNDWSLKSFEVDGHISPPRERNKNDRMIFYTDKSVESISSEKVQKGIWSYDKVSQIIKVVDINNKFDMQLKLISVTNLECILEIENPKGTFVKLHMISRK